MPTPIQEQSIATESIQTASMRAMGLLASGRAWLIFLITLALLLQVGLFAAANWGDVLHKRPAAPAEPNAQAPQGNPGADTTAGPPQGNFLQNFWSASQWQRVMVIGLPIAGCVTVISSLILVVLTITGIQVNLVGRLPALHAMISAFYWSVLTAVLVFPWGRVLGEAFAQMIPWVFCTYKDIDATVTAIAANDPAAQAGSVWLRFLAWPALALLAAWICGSRFGAAYWQVVGLAEMEAKAHAEQGRQVR